MMMTIISMWKKYSYPERAQQATDTLFPELRTSPDLAAALLEWNVYVACSPLLNSFSIVLIIQLHRHHHQQRTSFPLSSVRRSSAPFAFLSSYTSVLFSSRLFKSLQILYPVVFTRVPCSHFNVHIDSRALRFITLPQFSFQLPPLPIKLSLSPFPSYITPPPLSPLPPLSLPQSVSACLNLSYNAPSTTYTSPIARPKHFRCPQGPRESSHPLLPHPCFHSPSATPRRPSESARCHSSHGA